MIELLEKEVEKEVNVDFNEVFQRMTLDAIGPLYTFNITFTLPLLVSISLFWNITLMLTSFTCGSVLLSSVKKDSTANFREMCSCNECELPERQRRQVRWDVS